MATFQHDLSSMLRSNGFKPTKRGGYKMHKRRDGVIELMVCKGNSKKPLRAWYRAKPRRELFVQSGEFERVPPWAIGRARRNASKGGMSRATAGFITRGGHQERTIIRRRGEDKEEQEEKDDELREVLRRAIEERRKAAAREGRRPTGVVRIPRGAKARAAKRHTTSDAKLRERKSSPLSAEEMGMSQDMWDRMYAKKNPATAWDTDLTVPQLWREADGGSYPAMVELKRIGAYRPEIGKQAQWTKNVKWAKSNRGRARKNTTASPQARGFTFMHAEMGQEWAEWALSRQGIKHRTGAVAKANRSRRGRKRYQTRKESLRSKGSGPRGGYTAAERGALAKKWFLKPKSRTWPVADPRHAVIAIQYMTAGRGKPSEYPTLIRRLAKLWPLRQNKAIWKHYLKNRTKIARKAGRPMPTLNALDKG